MLGRHHLGEIVRRRSPAHARAPLTAAGDPELQLGAAAESGLEIAAAIVVVVAVILQVEHAPVAVLAALQGGPSAVVDNVADHALTPVGAD